MRPLAPARRGLRVVMLPVVLVALLGVVLAWYALREQGAEVITGSAGTAGWKTLAYDGVEVDVPSTWERLDMAGCDFRFERWGPPGVPPCDPDAEGLAFYGSATFDAELGPGVITRDGGDWAGYVHVGELAVHVAADDRLVVRTVLDSAR